MRAKIPPDAREALHLEMDGQLTAGERELLERALESDPEARRERQELERLRDLLTASRVGVPADFASRVMASLPAAGWESRHPRSWAAALGVLALLTGGAVAAAGLFGARPESASVLAATAAAIGGLLATSLATGAGLLGASWEGLGVALVSLLEGSVVNWIAFVVLVVGVDLLLLRLLRRPAPAAARRRGSSRE